MSKPDEKQLLLYAGDAEHPGVRVLVASLFASRIVVCSQYADLRDEHDKLIATITWTSPVQAKLV